MKIKNRIILETKETFYKYCFKIIDRGNKISSGSSSCLHSACFEIPASLSVVPVSTSKKKNESFNLLFRQKQSTVGIWILNLSGIQVRMPNGLLFKCHLNTGQPNHLNTRQMDAILFSMFLVQYLNGGL